jgi:hypothetical protein
VIRRSASIGDVRGEAHPDARTTLVLGNRGVAVAEKNAALAWRVEHGNAAVEQTAGKAFYRVEHGGPFVVHTPAGAVEVRGTCFSVEVEDMKIGSQGLIGAGIGGALSATVLVAVYEGHVSFANERGQVALAAGERASAHRGGAPAMLANGHLDSAPAVAGLSPAQQQELVALRARVHVLETGGAVSGAPAASHREEHNYLNPSKEELEKAAKECRLGWDEPDLDAQRTLSADDAAEMGLSPGEAQTMNEVNTSFAAKTTADLRALYVELTGNTAAADTLSPASLIQEIQDKTPRAEAQASYQRLSRERAGLQAAAGDPSGQSPIEKLMRLRTSMGERYEHDLGAAIGADLAHQLREKNGGWGSRHSSSYGCPSQP